MQFFKETKGPWEYELSAEGRNEDIETARMDPHRLGIETLELPPQKFVLTIKYLGDVVFKLDTHPNHNEFEPMLLIKALEDKFPLDPLFDAANRPTATYSTGSHGG
jgi:hypothetical protein